MNRLARSLVIYYAIAAPPSSMPKKLKLKASVIRPLGIAFQTRIHWMQVH